MSDDSTRTPGGNAAAVSFTDFVAYAPSRSCIYLPCKTPWPNASVDTRLPRMPLLDGRGKPVVDGKGKPKTIAASEWLEKNQSVEAFTWIPGEPEFIKDKLAVDGGWVRKPGATTLNTYRPPEIVPGDAGKAQRWVDHWRKLYRDDTEHLLAWMAARVQRPEVKPNHAIVLGGQPGIGKDTLLEPLVTAVGAWNFRDVTASQLFSKNNEFLRGVILRVSEARDMGEQGQTSRYGLYEHAKSALAIPPDTLRVNEKYLREYHIFNRFGMIITTNYRDALYLPDNDRRYFITYSDQAPGEFDPAFWKDFWAWYRNGGIEHVVAWLRQYDLSAFDPKATPRRTTSFDYMVGTERGEEYAELLNAIAALGNPKALTLVQLMEKAPALEWLHDTHKRRFIRHRLEECGYIVVPNPDAVDRLWYVNKKRQVIYTQSGLPYEQRRAAAQGLQDALDEHRQ